ncbi:hypothetical protein ABH926_005302 [Catenulispora sp. GP43]|uniref:hypothetical protein n=1 Tax=Catenulispora sp. GP43 TaxID=3156263 RepID=UPI0035112F6E
MSSTSAVGVLAQGLRDLRDFAEGPEDEELRERTGLTAGQIDAALGGERLPTREVTLALVEAWEGDVEAWREYWGQIAELAEEDESRGGERNAGEGAPAPAPPEPSIITPIPEVEPDEAESVQLEPADTDQADEEHAGTAAEQDAEVEVRAGVADEVGAEPAGAKTAAGVSEPAEVAHASAAAKAAVEVEAETRSQAEAELPARAESASVAVSPEPAKKRSLARVGIPVLLFAVGVGVGAFGDHALNSKQSSSTTAASVPPVASSARPSHTAALSPSSSGASSPASSAGSAPSPTDSSGTSSGSGSPSSSSTVAQGTVLGAYVGIQLASGYSVNFLSDPYHPSAGTSNGPDTMGFFAGSFVDGRFYADRVAILDPTDTGSFSSCLNDTRYQHDVLLSQIATGSSFCITTGTGHLVLVTVRRLPSSTDANPYAVLDVTVWQGS